MLMYSLFIRILGVISTIHFVVEFGGCHQKDWDYLVFAQRWPSAACLDMEKDKCVIPEGVTDWIIHGLWPNFIHGYPSFCNNTWKFNSKDIESIMPELEVKWPNLIPGSSSTSFWRHEWVKHGTCAASSENLHGVFKYFNYTLQLHETYNLYEVLKISDILPEAGRPYVLEFMENSLHTVIGKKPKIFCRKHKEYDYAILDTVYVCVDKNFENIDCDISEEASCKETYILYLPLHNHQPTCPRFTEL